MMDGIGLGANVGFKFGVTDGAASWRSLLGLVPRKGGRRKDLAGQSYAVDQWLQILRRGQQVRIDQRRRERVGTGQGDATATARIQAQPD